MSSKHRRECGLSLLEILIALAILGIGIAAATSYLWRIEREVQIENAKVMQHHLADRLQLALSNPDAIRNSIDLDMSIGNDTLRSCIEPGRICNSVSPATQTRFNLLAAGRSPDRIAGDLVSYSTQGKLCTPPSAGCHFDAEVWFWGTCAIDATGVPQASCTSPAYLNFRFRIAPRPGSRVQAVGSFSDYPPAGPFNADTTSFTVRLRTAEVLLRTMQECGPDQYVKEIDRNGLVVCECVVPEVNAAGTRTNRRDGFGRPACGSQRCRNDYEIMVGFTPQGTIRCIDERTCSRTPMPVDCPCKIIDLTTTGDCGSGFWMVSIDYGLCEATTVGKGGKGATEKVKCSRHVGRCCKLDSQ